MEKILIFGHQKPDTDTVTSSIALSYLKNQLGFNTEPRILGEVNNETKYVLNYFNIEIPKNLDDVKLQIKDLNYHKALFINEKESIIDTYNFMIKNNITGTPIVDSNNKFIGLITLKDIVKKLVNEEDFNSLVSTYNNIIQILNGEEILKYDDDINGELLIAAYKSATFVNDVQLNKNNILIVGDRNSVIEHAIDSKIKLIIIVGNSELSNDLIEKAKLNKVNIIKTKYDSFHASKLIGLSNCISSILTNDRPYTFDENYYYDDFIAKTNKLKFNNYPIISKNGICKGLIRITEINEKNRKKVILVDHNEFEQSVEGLNEAEILEVVDHHKVGNISTNNPINFRIMSVGSTNTIIYQMFKENNIEIPNRIAGLMLAGVLSDTLSLTSPTTTKYDVEVVVKLACRLDLDYNKFALEMFKAGTSLKERKIEDIILSDIKSFEVGDSKIAISQIFTLNYEEILDNKDKYLDYIEKLCIDKDYKMVIVLVTDIIKKGSYILYTRGDEEIISNALSLEKINQGTYLDGVVSRKKQIIPLLLEVLI